MFKVRYVKIKLGKCFVKTIITQQFEISDEFMKYETSIPVFTLQYINETGETK